MSTKLYLHDATSTLTGTLPSDEQSANYPNWGAQSYAASGATTLRTLNTTIGLGNNGRSFTSLANQTRQQCFIAMFLSNTLDVDQTVGGGSMIINLAQSESNTNMNLNIAMFSIYVWRPSNGSKVGVLTDSPFSAVGSGSAEPSAASTEKVNHITGATSSAVSALAGDIIVCEVYADFTQGMSTAYTGILNYDGTTENTTADATVSNHASYIQLAETLTFGTPNSFKARPPYLINQATKRASFW